MTSKVFPALLLLGFLIVVIASFQSSPLQSTGLSVLPGPRHQPDATKDSTPEMNLKRYWMVLLKKGPNRQHSKADAAKIQAAHMANLERIAETGKLTLAGPFGDSGALRGILILDSQDSMEVASLVKADSAVVTGRLTFEIKPWWTEKNCLFN